MASQEITVDTSTLNTDISELTEVLGNTRTQLKKMFEEITALDTMWDGPANQVFTAQFAKDAAYAEEICQIIESLLNCMTYAKDQYNTCEGEVSSIISSI